MGMAAIQYSPPYGVEIQPSKAVHTNNVFVSRLKRTNTPANLILFTCRVINI